MSTTAGPAAATKGADPADLHHDHADHDHGAHGHHAHDHGHGHAHHGHDHGAGHDHRHDLRALGTRALGGALLVTFGFFLIELAAGFATGSLALLSDAVHMVTDVMALAVAYAAARLRSRPRVGRATFGLARLPVLGGLFNGLLAVVTAVFIILEAVERLRAPPPVPGGPILAVAVVGLLVNLGCAWWLHRSGDRGVNARGALLHMLGDALGSVAAIVAGVAILVSGAVIVDALASLVVAGIVAASAVPLLRDVVSILLQHAPKDLDLEAVKAAARARPEVTDVVSLHAWELDSGDAVASLTLTTAVRDLAQLTSSADALRAILEERFSLSHVTIEWRPDDNAKACCA